MLSTTTDPAAIAARVLAESPPDAAVRAWETMSDPAREYVAAQATRAGQSVEVFLAEADASRIARGADPFDAAAVARAARR